MADIETVRTWQGRTMIDPDGGYIGSIDAIYVDDASGRLAWALVAVGVAGTTSTFVPIAEATAAGGDVRVPYPRQLVKDAPSVDPDGQLSAAEERDLFRHYDLEYGHTATPTQSRGTAEDAGPATSGRPAGDDTTDRDAAAAGQMTDDAMTRSEEELRVGTEPRERGRVRLRKYVDTEQVQLTVPVRQEKLRMEWEPAGDADRDTASSGSELAGSEHEITLHQEEPVVEKRVVPRERVRLAKDTVTGEREVSEELRKEQIDLEREP